MIDSYKQAVRHFEDRGFLVVYRPEWHKKPIHVMTTANGEPETAQAFATKQELIEAANANPSALKTLLTRRYSKGAQ